MASHKDIVRNFYDAIGQHADQDIVPALLCEDFSFRGSLGLIKRGNTGFRAYMDFIRGALGEYRCEIVDMVEEGDKLYARMRYSGVHHGELFGYEATHTRLEWDGIAAFTFRDGKVAELWVLGDVQSIMQQLARYFH